MQIARTQRSAAAAASLVLAAAGVAAGSDAGAAGTAASPAIALTTSPNVQWLETKVVAKLDASTHSRTPTLVLGTARFTITVRNPGAVTLSGVTVTDPLSQACNRSIGTLAPGASVAYRCSAANVGRSFTNTVTVTASARSPADARLPAGAQATAEATATASAKTVVKVKKPKKRTSHAPRLAFTG